MSLIALVIWITTAAAGLYLLSIWLIEYDKDFQSVAATRLPPSVLAVHVLLAGGGLLVWIAYIISDQDRLAWTALAAVVLAAMLGMTMAVRWVSVYRATQDAKRDLASQAGAGCPLWLAATRGVPAGRSEARHDSGARPEPGAAGTQLPAAGRRRAWRVRRRDHHAGAADRARQLTSRPAARRTVTRRQRSQAGRAAAIRPISRASSSSGVSRRTPSRAMPSAQ